MSGGALRNRRRLGVLVAAVGVLATSGCTVPVTGVTGVGVDAKGQPVGYLAVCDEHVDGATLSFEVDAPGSDEDTGVTVNAGRWASGGPVTGESSWSMVEPASGWEARGTFRGVAPGKAYSLWGWTADNTWSTASVSFTAEDLSRLRPGEVLTNEYDPTTDAETVVVQDESEFFAEQCDGWGEPS